MNITGALGDKLLKSPLNVVVEYFKSLPSFAMSEKADNTLAVTTVMMCLFFGTNALLYLLFLVVKNSSSRPTEDLTRAKDKKEKELSKPFLGTLDCFFNLTSELFRTGLIMALTYICENHWIFEHSGKSYSRDLFLFVLIIFFAYGFYTIKPVHDLTLLSREQTEEWKGWMQFIFLLYHYFHAEEVYNSVRVMITCYVWMTGFGNFSFFYMKQDFGWLRVVQMLWRLNFSVLLLMWTHGNTYILYYICPMHTFYFLMVYLTMYLYASVNHTKWGIRWKLVVVGILIYIVWDINGGLFDFLFQWLGTDSVIGATRGSVWEYYFRTSLDHWSSFLGMIFALNFPLAEQYFGKAKGAPLLAASVGMAIVTLWWGVEFYSKEKLEYNLTHSYSAIIPLTSYIFFRNLTPAIRSGVSMSMHDLGKTTLETYLLQHHIWLTSNAKTLLTIVPGHPWINFALATLLFFFVSKELYRLTMSLRGMMMPDDKNITWINCIGMTCILSVLYTVAFFLASLHVTLAQISLVCIGLLFPVTLLIISRFARHTADNFAYQLWAKRALVAAAAVFVLLGTALLAFGASRSLSSSGAAADVPATLSPSTVFLGRTPVCQAAISHGSWVETKCAEPPAPALNKAAYCATREWSWDTTGASVGCPVSRLSSAKARQVFSGKRVAFVGDSILRGAYHQFSKLLNPAYHVNASSVLKHSNLKNSAPGMNNSSVSFIWAPFVMNVSSYLREANAAKRYDFIVTGAAAWDALYTRSVDIYSSDLNTLSEMVGSPGDAVIAWLQPTLIVDGKLPTPEKRQFMTEDVMRKMRAAFLSSKAAAYFTTAGTIIDPSLASATRSEGSVDGVHYSEEVYSVIAQMVANAYANRFPAFYTRKIKPKKMTPKPTGSMSFPFYGAVVLILSVFMLFTMDSFLGIGYLSLYLFGRSFDWDAAYGSLHRKILGPAKQSLQREGHDAKAVGGGRGERDDKNGGQAERESLLLSDDLKALDGQEAASSTIGAV